MTLEEGTNLLLMFAEAGCRPTQPGGRARKSGHMTVVRRGADHRMVEKHEELAVQELGILIEIARAEHRVSGNARVHQRERRVEGIARRAPTFEVRVFG